MKEKQIMVRVTFEIPVNIPDDPEYDAYFDIEENHCPGTGLVGAAIDEWIKKHDEERNCWGCSANGKNEIIH